MSRYRDDVLRAFDVAPSEIGIEDAPLESEIRLDRQRRAALRQSHRAPGDAQVEIDALTSPQRPGTGEQR